MLSADRLEPEGLRILLGVGAGVAAYKCVTLVRLLQRSGHKVRVLPTPDSLQFVGAATWHGLTGYPVSTSVFTDRIEDGHVELAREADLIVIAPATADLIARLRCGMANDLLTATVLAAQAPVVLAPAMHTQMWRAAATQDNLTTLRERGWIIIEPAVGDLSCGDFGAGRLPEPDTIALKVREAARTVCAHRTRAFTGDCVSDAGRKPLRAVSALVTTGGTREPLDPVRYLGNHSSGRQGIAVATALAELGASVELLAANVDQRLIPAYLHHVNVTSAEELAEATFARLNNVDLVVCVAAVADFRPREPQEHKIKKTDRDAHTVTIELERTTDILATITAQDPRPFTVGFAAETGDAHASALDLGKAKARSKGADLLVINEVGGERGFGDVVNTVTIVDHNGDEVSHFSGAKMQVGVHIAHVIAQTMPASKASQNRL